MDSKIYQYIYKNLRTHKDIYEISRDLSIRKGIIFSIFHLKTVRFVKQHNSQIIRKAPAMHRLWLKGDTLLEIAGQNNFPPVLIASIILKEMGHSSRSVIKKPEILSNRRLRNEVIQAIEDDLHFSPGAHIVQSNTGKLGEEIIYKWLIDNKVNFIIESEMRKKPNTKTPDFLLNEPLDIEGNQVKWIESKAVFADDGEHRRYHKKQLSFYEELYGYGMVVYWHGYLDNIVSDIYMIKDNTFFEKFEYDVDRLIGCVIDSEGLRF